MPRFRDQLGREVELAKKPKRLVSLVPSQTELLAYLGLAEETLGITAWCEHPRHWRAEKTVVGGTKNIDREKIAALQPDLILANKEENPSEQIEALMEDYPVWVSDVHNIPQAQEMISALGELTGTHRRASELNRAISQARLSPANYALPALYLIWKDPYMVAGHDSYINALLAELGLANRAPQNRGRYPQMTPAEIAASGAQVILLSSEPYAFCSGDSQAFWQSGRLVKLVDGALFSWYGSRLLPALAYLRQLRKELDLLAPLFSQGKS